MFNTDFKHMICSNNSEILVQIYSMLSHLDSIASTTLKTKIHYFTRESERKSEFPNVLADNVCKYECTNQGYKWLRSDNLFF